MAGDQESTPKRSSVRNPNIIMVTDVKNVWICDFANQNVAVNDLWICCFAKQNRLTILYRVLWCIQLLLYLVYDALNTFY